MQWTNGAHSAVRIAIVPANSHGQRARQRLRDPKWWASVIVGALLIGVLWQLGRGVLADDAVSLTGVVAIGLVAGVCAVGGELLSVVTTRAAKN